MVVNWLFLSLEYFLGVLLVFITIRFFGLKGIYALGAMLVLYMNVAVLKAYDLLPGVQLYAGVFLGPFFITLVAIVTEVYGYREAQKLVAVGFFAQVVFLAGMLVALGYVPSNEDWAHEHMKALFLPVWRTTIFSWIAFVVSGVFKARFQDFLKRTEGLFGKHLWLRDNAATKLAQLVDNVIFFYGALTGYFSLRTITVFLIWTTLFEWLFDYLDTWVVVKGVKWMTGFHEETITVRG
ncbi:MULTISPECIES: queuosine precursor transporter [Thermotoga]|uniref:Queuosine precursor transporter n=2 Tax=Thermotoga neapolitana TaxID=2337 RepID=B9KB32_THENN|nr:MULTISPECIES: queuosine precursor transporter [Thermotoga]ACM22228.1 Putative uncharacterized protein [Thermotoga neapolitana DSM 4359]AJG40195.1 hypothetical protein TRQ7_01750 [Thermotoga sp. RQ7]KFZ22624.1 hypothetical protein LA10_00095 [Thermotoga neapolitana LA10]